MVKSLDLHGIRHSEVDRLVENFVLLNKPPLTIITGNSHKMKDIVGDVLKRHNIKFSDVKLDELFNGKINIFSRGDGHVNHCISEFSYIINVDIDHYVHINDLNMFLKMHFGQSNYLNMDEQKDNIKVEKNDIMKYLNFDYYIYNNILNSNNLWKWNQGKIF